ncbi:MAG: acetylornithine deacetylase [Gaiellales bacterium]|jgi:acetylornithine deacetylase|nr:acetylornithine deacetylase [Gaiellales bacterium]
MDVGLAQALGGAVDALADDLVEATGQAVRIPSVTPNYPDIDPGEHIGGEARVSALLAEHYAAIGCVVDVFGEVAGRENAVGVLRGTGGGRSLIFNGHVDVVPAGAAESWRFGDPWSGRVADGRIYGRGACDMKGGLLAQAFAARALVETGVRLRGDLILEAVVGEEMMEHELGTSACIARGYRADGAVVAEPSGPPHPLAVMPVTAGVLSFTLSVEGKTTHAALRGPTLQPGGERFGVSAIDKIALVYEALRGLERDWATHKHHPLFEDGHFAIYPGVVVGGPSSGLVPFFIADQARIEYVIVHHPDDDPDAVRAEIEHCVTRAAGEDAWLRAHPPAVVWNHRWPAGKIDPEHPLVLAACHAHRAATGEEARVHGFAAVEDTTFLTSAGIPAISYGPGDLRIAHAVDEHVEIDELVTACKTFAMLAATWCDVA